MTTLNAEQIRLLVSAGRLQMMQTATDEDEARRKIELGKTIAELEQLLRRAEPATELLVEPSKRPPPLSFSARLKLAHEVDEKLAKIEGADNSTVNVLTILQTIGVDLLAKPRQSVAVGPIVKTHVPAETPARREIRIRLPAGAPALLANPGRLQQSVWMALGNCDDLLGLPRQRVQIWDDAGLTPVQAGLAMDIIAQQYQAAARELRPDGLTLRAYELALFAVTEGLADHTEIRPDWNLPCLCAECRSCG